MDLSSTPLEQLGASAHGHYKAAEKAQEKAEQQMMSAGLYLKEAQERLKRRKDMNFAEFLLKHCPIGKSRAYEIIAIADGRKTVEEVREANAFRQAEKRQRDVNVRDVTDTQPEKPNVFNEAPPQPKPQPKPQSFVDQAQAAHDALLKEVIALVRKQDTTSHLKLKDQLK